MGIEQPTARIEIIAMYGGLQFTMGLYLFYCALQPSRASQGLLLAVFHVCWASRRKGLRANRYIR